MHNLLKGNAFAWKEHGIFCDPIELLSIWAKGDLLWVPVTWINCWESWEIRYCNWLIRDCARWNANSILEVTKNVITDDIPSISEHCDFILSLVQVLLRRSNSVDHMATQPHQLQLSDKKGVLWYLLFLVLNQITNNNNLYLVPLYYN